MVTPQITLRVDPDVLAVWKEKCAEEGISVSEKIRELMGVWVATQDVWPPVTDVK